jgi:hypothetical protein
MSDRAPHMGLIGRERELRAFRELLDGIQERGAAVIVRGEAGIGQSSPVYPRRRPTRLYGPESLSQRIGKASVRVKDAPA